jgi:putative endonuclease
MYVGKTTDLKRRVEEHNAGQNISTKPYRPWKIIFYEAYINRDDANRREKYLKTTQGRQALRRMLKCYLERHSIKYFEY